MLVVNRLNLEPQWGYRKTPPKGHIKFEFQLDDESSYYLVEEACKCKTELEIEQFEEAIKQSAYLTLFQMDQNEFKTIKKGELPPYIRLVRDPTRENRLFGFQFKNTSERGKLAIMKLKIFEENNL